MTQLSQNIVGTIKRDHIAPVPHWHFLLKRYAFWFFLGLSMLLGSLSFSVIVHIVNSGDLDIASHLQGDIFTSAVMLLPYVWFLSLCLCELVAYYNWKHTRFGYRFRRRWIFVSSIAVSMLLGSGLYALGMGTAIDNVMVGAVPFYYQSKHSARRQIWMQPDKGLLVGKVIQIGDLSGGLVIKDEDGKNWNIDASEVQSKTPMLFQNGKIVKIIGTREGASEFVATQIRKCGDCWRDEDDLPPPPPPPGN